MIITLLIKVFVNNKIKILPREFSNQKKNSKKTKLNLSIQY